MTQTQSAPEAGAEITNEQRRDASCKVARTLRYELSNIDQQIRQLELQAGAEPDLESETVKTLRARREELVRRRQELPGMLCGARGAALRAEAGRLQELADREVKPLLEAATTEHEEASAEVTKLTAALESAKARLAEAERQHRLHEREWQMRVSDIGAYTIDAGRAEQGLPLTYQERFEGLEQWSGVVPPVVLPPKSN